MEIVVEKKREKGRRKKSDLSQQGFQHFALMIAKYVKIETLQIVITTKTGEEYLIKRNRKIIDDKLICYDDTNNPLSIPLTSILKADLYAT